MSTFSTSTTTTVAEERKRKQTDTQYYVTFKEPPKKVGKMICAAPVRYTQPIYKIDSTPSEDLLNASTGLPELGPKVMHPTGRSYQEALAQADRFKGTTPTYLYPHLVKNTAAPVQEAPTVYHFKAAGESWEDPTLSDWNPDDWRIFVGDLGNEVNEDLLIRAFNKYPSFQKARVCRDKRSGKARGFGFVSFSDPHDFARALKEMNGKYIGNRPCKLRKSKWKDRLDMEQPQNTPATVQKPQPKKNKKHIPVSLE